VPRRWRIHPHDPAQIAAIERTTDTPPVVAQLLSARGIVEPSAARAFLDAKLSDLRDPDDLPGAREAAERLHAAVKAKRRIMIYGDYDADGMTGAALLLNCLRLLGANVGYHVPNRLEDGYGLNHEALESLAERGAELIVTVDCGIASVAEAETAARLGLELIVTDHHKFADKLPAAAVLVHPNLPDHNYPFTGLCGAGVALKIAWSLCRLESGSEKVTERLRGFLMSAVGLAALGTVADMVPLIDENRVLVRHGLTSLKGAPTIGLKALLKVTELENKKQLGSDDIGFRLAPRLNAAGRFGQATLGVELLTTESPERAAALADYIHDLNKQRETLETSIYKAAHKQIKEDHDAENDPAFVLSGDWHSGVIGIVAGRLAERYYRPVIVLNVDPLNIKPAQGSARSGGALDLHAALQQCSDRLITCGGHAAAAGLTLEANQIDAFRAEFCDHVASTLTSEQKLGEWRIDAETTFAQMTLPTVRQMDRLAPFGQGNPRPLFCARGVTLADPAKRMGGGERHMQAKFEQHRAVIRAVAFGRGDWADELNEAEGPLDIVFRPKINDYRMARVEMELVDWRPAGSV